MFLQAFGLSSKNPVLKNITDYLIEEASAEEEELLGMSGDKEEGQLGGDGDGPIERDPSLIKVRNVDESRFPQSSLFFIIIIIIRLFSLLGIRQADTLPTNSSFGRLLQSL